MTNASSSKKTVKRVGLLICETDRSFAVAPSTAKATMFLASAVVCWAGNADSGDAFESEAASGDAFKSESASGGVKNQVTS